MKSEYREIERGGKKFWVYYRREALQAASKGGRILDLEVPLWWEKIKKEIDQSEAWNAHKPGGPDVLSQLYGTYYEGGRALDFVSLQDTIGTGFAPEAGTKISWLNLGWRWEVLKRRAKWNLLGKSMMGSLAIGLGVGMSIGMFLSSKLAYSIAVFVALLFDNLAVTSLCKKSSDS